MLLSEDHTVCYTWLWHTAHTDFYVPHNEKKIVNKTYVDICGK